MVVHRELRNRWKGRKRREGGNHDIGMFIGFSSSKINSVIDNAIMESNSLLASVGLPAISTVVVVGVGSRRFHDCVCTTVNEGDKTARRT